MEPSYVEVVKNKKRNNKKKEERKQTYTRHMDSDSDIIDDNSSCISDFSDEDYDYDEEYDSDYGSDNDDNMDSEESEEEESEEEEKVEQINIITTRKEKNKKDQEKKKKKKEEILFNIFYTIENPKKNQNEYSDMEESEIEESEIEESEIEESEIEEKEVNKNSKSKKLYKKNTYALDMFNNILNDCKNTDLNNSLEKIPEDTNDTQLKNKFLKQMDKYMKKEQKKMDLLKEKKEKKEKQKNTKELMKLMREKSKINDYKYFKTLDINEQKEIMEEVKKIKEHTIKSIPYRISLIRSKIPIEYKPYAMRKINTLRYMEPGSGEYYKIKQWVDTFMQIPFGNYNTLNLTLSDGIEKCHNFMNNSKDILNKAVYGLNDAKMQVIQLLGQWISNPLSIGSAIAIKGPPGTGKTSLVKNGISKILNRPFAFISLGGATDSSILEGHSYTYEGSSWGKIVDILIKSKCMNPVIYFDELDKVSDTPKGEEIIGLLTHLIDTTQNTQFHDKYFNDIEFDLSKALFIFSYNDENKVNNILKDRMYRIETKGYDTKEKIIIVNNYLIPVIRKNVNFKEDENIIIEDHILEHIIENYTEKEKGVRNLKRCIEIIYTKLNLYRLIEPSTKIFDTEDESFKLNYPFYVTIDICDRLLKSIKNDSKVMLYKSMFI